MRKKKGGKIEAHAIVEYIWKSRVHTREVWGCPAENGRNFWGDLSSDAQKSYAIVWQVLLRQSIASVIMLDGRVLMTTSRVGFVMIKSEKRW